MRAKEAARREYEEGVEDGRREAAAVRESRARRWHEEIAGRWL